MAKTQPAAYAQPTLAFASAPELERWLERNHASASGVWIKLARAGSGTKSVSYQEAVEVALCWGWIDGQKKGLDDTAWLQRFSPRGPKSIWSKINREKAQKLIAAGKMQPPGLAQVERAKKDGRWDAAYDSPRSAEVPEDLRAALKKDKKAATFFETLDGANRYSILFRLHHAKKPETRARKIREFVAMLARGEKLHYET